MINYDEIKPALKIAARENFWAFCAYYDYQFFVIERRFFKDVALAFQRVVDEFKQGRAITVSVSMPPRSGKSYITSLFSAFWLSKFHELSVMRNCCTATLYQKFSYDTRNILRSEKYKEIFPEIELQSDKQNLDGWNLTTSKQVGYFGAGVGGTIIGFGANIAITDDLYKSMQDALSSTKNDFVKLWKESAHDSRKEKNCPEIFIGTRWTKDDVIGTEIDKGNVDIVIKIKALTDDDKSFCENVKSTDEYLKIRENISKSVFLAEYQQEPTSLEGLLIPFDSLRFADTSKIPQENIIFRFAIGDPADTGGDKYSMPYINVASFNEQIICYVSDALHSTYGIEANTNRIVEKISKNNTENILLESNGVGLAAILLLKNHLPTNRKLIPFNSSVNKEVRILSHYEFVRDYFVFDSEKYKTDPEYKLFVSDLTSYMKEGDNKNKKDAMDIMCSAAHVIKLKYKNILYK